MSKKKATVKSSEQEVQDLIEQQPQVQQGTTSEVGEFQASTYSIVDDTTPVANEKTSDEISSDTEEQVRKLTEEMKAKVVEVKPTLTLTDAEGHQTSVSITPAQMQAIENASKAQKEAIASITLENLLKDLKKDDSPAGTFISIADLIKEIREGK